MNPQKDIKRIIREEMDNSLGWINDIKPALNQNQNWILVNDVDPSDMEESIKIQNYLFDIGYKWFSSELINDTIYSIHHFPSKGLRGDLTYYNNKENERELADREIERNNDVYYWSQIKPKLNESDEDNPLQWIKEPRKNDLDGLKLGYHPIHKENPMVVIDNGEREVIIRTHGNGDFKYDRRTVKAFIERGTWDIITESDDPLQWIKDQNPIPHVSQLKVGDEFSYIHHDGTYVTCVVEAITHVVLIVRTYGHPTKKDGHPMSMSKRSYERRRELGLLY